MDFIYRRAGLSKDRLVESIDLAARRLYDKLKAFDVGSLGISDYNKKYFDSYLARLIPSLRLYSYIIYLSLAKSCVPLNKFVFLDYGGGSGIMSLLAKELGIGVVIYADIYDVSCHDAKVIAQSIGNEADHYVCGDLEALIDFLRENSLSCDAVASYDVIEHVYDIESCLKRLPLCSNGPLTVVMASGANARNPRVARKLVRKHLDFEYNDREKEWGNKDGHSCLRSYFKVRREMVLEHLQELEPKLTEGEVEQLARNTRGMVESDIRRCVDEYLRTGKFPPAPKHATNTCDPYSGNWAEHLMDQSYLADLLRNVGFEVEIRSGYYSGSENIIKARLSALLNVAIRVLGTQGVSIAPYFVLYGRRA